MNVRVVDLVDDLEIKQGATYSLTVTYDDGAEPPVAINLTGYTAKLQLRLDYNSPSAALELTHSAGLTMGGVAGTIIVTMTDTQTRGLVPGWYVYDLEITSAGGVVTRLIEGKVKVSAEATK